MTQDAGSSQHPEALFQLTPRELTLGVVFYFIKP